jgi:signal transduction histidine kinase
MGPTEAGLVAEEQAALRRVATLVAGGVSPEGVFAAVAEEVGRLLGIDFTIISRCEPADAQVSVGTWSNTAAEVPFPVGTRVRLGGRNVVSLVVQTGRPARIDDYADASGMVADAARGWRLRSAVGVPISVEGRLWGVMAVASGQEWPMPSNTEKRLAAFTELVATAIANAQARMELRSHTEEQAALRRVATLVAQGAPPEAVFDAVTAEVARLLSSDLTLLSRYDPDGKATIVGACTSTGAPTPFPVGSRFPVSGRDLHTPVLRTGFQSVVGVPISVEGRLWGVIEVTSTRDESLPADTEARVTGFTELVATAIANAEARAALTASRARIVAASDETRRRIERDLHDGIQQRLVALGLELRAAQAALPSHLGECEGALSRVAQGLASMFDEVREICQGLHPAILSEGGLEPALAALRRRSPLPVELDLHIERGLPEPVEVAAYYVVSEAMTNAAKHAHASLVNVALATHEETLRLAIRDDGIGGADPGRGSGLLGLTDRVEALGGTLQVASPAGKGTALLIEIPLNDHSGAASTGP